ncbi:MAG: L,D-transpeptidase [Erysipelotrichales bacterium]
MSKKKKIIMGISIPVSVLLIVFIGGVIYFNSHIIPNTKLYDQKVSVIDQPTVDNIVSDQKVILKVKDKRKEVKIDLSKIDYEVKSAKEIEKDILEEQNTWAWPIKIFSSQNFENIGITPNKDSLKKELKANKVAPKKGLSSSKDAYFDVDEASGDVKVVKEVIGEKMDRDLVYKEVSENFAKGTYNIDLAPAIIMPNVEEKVLNKTLEEVEYKLTSEINISIKSLNKNVKPSKKDRLKWLMVDYKKNSVSVDKNAIRNYFKTVNNSYIKENKNNDTIYRVGNGKSTLIQTGKPVSGLDEDALTAKVYDAVLNNYNLSENVEAVKISKPKVVYEGHKSIDDKLVEVSIADQKVYLYSSGKLIKTAEVVTGKPNGTMDTTKGKYTVMYKTTNFTLKGDAYGYDYKLPVKYWIPFEGGGGIGLHDAPWRAHHDFGGQRYKTTGSHGCVNMRLEDVRFIYNEVVAGTAVWVH